MSASLGSTSISSATTRLNGIFDFLLGANLSTAFFLSSSMPESLASGGTLTELVDSAEESSGDGVGSATTLLGAGVDATNFPFLLTGTFGV